MKRAIDQAISGLFQGLCQFLGFKIDDQGKEQAHILAYCLGIGQASGNPG